jgi:hypothetical protein
MKSKPDDVERLLVQLKTLPLIAAADLDAEFAAYRLSQGRGQPGGAPPLDARLRELSRVELEGRKVRLTPIIVVAPHSGPKGERDERP